MRSNSIKIDDTFDICQWCSFDDTDNCLLLKAPDQRCPFAKTIEAKKWQIKHKIKTFERVRKMVGNKYATIETVKLARSLLSKIPRQYWRRLAIWGGVGCGKTTILAAVMILSGGTQLYTSASNAVRLKINEGIGVIDFPDLIIDDFDHRLSGAQIRELSELIDGYYRHQAALSIAGNLDEEYIETISDAGERLSWQQINSRVAEMCYPVVITKNVDYRMQKILAKSS